MDENMSELDYISYAIQDAYCAGIVQADYDYDGCDGVFFDNVTIKIPYTLSNVSLLKNIDLIKEINESNDILYFIGVENAEYENFKIIDTTYTLEEKYIVVYYEVEYDD